MTVRWLLGNMKQTPEEMAKNLVDAMPLELMKAFQEIHLV